MLGKRLRLWDTGHGHHQPHGARRGDAGQSVQSARCPQHGGSAHQRGLAAVPGPPGLRGARRRRADPSRSAARCRHRPAAAADPHRSRPLLRGRAGRSGAGASGADRPVRAAGAQGRGVQRRGAPAGEHRPALAPAAAGARQLLLRPGDRRPRAQPRGRRHPVRARMADAAAAAAGAARSTCRLHSCRSTMPPSAPCSGASCSPTLPSSCWSACSCCGRRPRSSAPPCVWGSTTPAAWPSAWRPWRGRPSWRWQPPSPVPRAAARRCSASFPAISTLADASLVADKDRVSASDRRPHRQSARTRPALRQARPRRPAPGRPDRRPARRRQPHRGGSARRRLAARLRPKADGRTSRLHQSRGFHRRSAGRRQPVRRRSARRTLRRGVAGARGSEPGAAGRRHLRARQAAARQPVGRCCCTPQASCRRACKAPRSAVPSWRWRTSRAPDCRAQDLPERT